MGGGKEESWRRFEREGSSRTAFPNRQYVYGEISTVSIDGDYVVTDQSKKPC